jgi:DNA polymerase I
MAILASINNFLDVLLQIKEDVKDTPFLSLDTETTGLNSYRNDRLFSLVISSCKEDYLFNFLAYKELSEEFTLPYAAIVKLSMLFLDKNIAWFIHNAKFDMAMLAKEGAYLSGIVHCTEAIARLERNTHLDYTLGACSERIGLKKSDEVEEYISKNKLFHWEDIPGKKKRVKIPHFYEVPSDILFRYLAQDGRITYQLGVSQIKRIDVMSGEVGKSAPTVKQVMDNERKVTKVIFDMEQEGITIDRKFCEEAIEYEGGVIEDTKRQFKEICGIEFKDSNKLLAEAFTKMGEDYAETEKGNPSFKDEFLEKYNTPLAKVVQAYREANKKLSTYYLNFLYFADSEDKIHANIKQSGTAPGRISCQNPNLQNLNKEDNLEEKYIVRRAFIPPKDFIFAMIDYDQMEYRLILDLSNEKSIIEKILYDGLDVHSATAQKMGVARDRAKTLNFLLIYGGGKEKLAKSLGISVNEATALKQAYFSSLPNLTNLSNRLIEAARQRKELFNWFGRRCYFPDSNFAYVAPNHFIQGGCADIVKIAMVKIHKFLEDKKSKLLLQIHDELLFKIHLSEIPIVTTLKNVMENVYPYKNLPMTCSVSWSKKSWADKVKGFPNEI